MSGEEKAAQVGTAVEEYQAAKVDLAHIERRAKEISEAFKRYAEALKEQGAMFRLRVENGRIKHPYGGEPKANLLMNESELIVFLAEWDAAIERKEHAAREMKALGITSVE
jgi:hypothetical protein